MTITLTRNDLILVAAKKLSQPFTTEDLVVAAWQIDKGKFGLKGFSDLYPDNNKVLTCLMGKSGLVGKGKLTKVGSGKYKVCS